MFGWFKKKKRKHLLPESAYQSDDPAVAFKRLHIQTAHEILDMWNGEERDSGTLMAITAHIGGTIEAARKHFPNRTPPVGRAACSRGSQLSAAARAMAQSSRRSACSLPA